MRVHRVRPERSRDVPQKNSYREYKDYLRSDFKERCGYCDDDDSFLGGARGYHIDHFAPRKKFSELECDYDNLVYSCPFCNGGKWDHWPSTCPRTSVVGDEGFIDPCSSEYDLHIERDNSGRLIAKTQLGQYIWKKLKLGLMRHKMIWRYGQLEERINELEGASSENKTRDESLLDLYRECKSLLDKIKEN